MRDGASKINRTIGGVLGERKNKRRESADETGKGREREREREGQTCVEIMCVSLSRSLALRVKLKSECESREFKSKYTRFGILGSTDLHRPCMRTRAEPCRAEPSRAEDRDRGRMRATRAALSFTSPLPADAARLPPTTIYGLCIRASIV